MVRSSYASLALVALTLAVIISVPLVSIPAMVVSHLAVAGLPISLIVLVRLIVRIYPSSALIWGPSVISLMPSFPIIRRGIPVAIHPDVSGLRIVRAIPNNTGRGRRADSDSYRELP